MEYRFREPSAIHVADSLDQQLKKIPQTNVFSSNHSPDPMFLLFLKAFKDVSRVTVPSTRSYVQSLVRIDVLERTEGSLGELFPTLYGGYLGKVGSQDQMCLGVTFAKFANDHDYFTGLHQRVLGDYYGNFGRVCCVHGRDDELIVRRYQGSGSLVDSATESFLDVLTNELSNAYILFDTETISVRPESKDYALVQYNPDF